MNVLLVLPVVVPFAANNDTISDRDPDWPDWRSAQPMLDKSRLDEHSPGNGTSDDHPQCELPPRNPDRRERREDDTGDEHEAVGCPKEAGPRSHTGCRRPNGVIGVKRIVRRLGEVKMKVRVSFTADMR